MTDNGKQPQIYYELRKEGHVGHLRKAKWILIFQTRHRADGYLL